MLSEISSNIVTIYESGVQLSSIENELNNQSKAAKHLLQLLMILRKSAQGDLSSYTTILSAIYKGWTVPYIFRVRRSLGLR